MSIGSALSNALSGLGTTAKSAELISSNVSNALTPGYAKRDLVVSSRHSAKGGVKIDAVLRQEDTGVINERRLADAKNEQSSALSLFFDHLIKLLGEPGSGKTLSDDISNLESKLIEASGLPKDANRLRAVLNAANAVAKRFNKISNGIQKERLQADSAINEQVKALNTSLTALKKLNQQIVAAQSGSENTASLMDKRNQQLDAISKILPVTILDRGKGKIALYSKSGHMLLDSNAVNISFKPTGNLNSQSSIENSALSSLLVEDQENVSSFDLKNACGTLAAAFQIRDVLGPEVQSKLDDLAMNFANPLVPSFENMQISEIHPRKPWPHTPEIPALTKTTHQVQDRSPLPSINERDSLLKNPIFSDKAQNIAKSISLFRVSEASIIAPTMTRKPVDFSAQPAQTELRLNTAAVVETTPRHPADRQLDQSAGQSNRQPLHSKSILLSESHVEPQFKLSIPSPASERAATDTSQPRKNIISGQFAKTALQHSNSNTIFENSFPVTAIEQGDPDITPPLQSDVSKSPLQAVLGSEKSRHPIMQQIVPKLIDQLVFKGDGKIDIMLSPKDLGKVEFSLQSHDKSGLSIVILAERDETAALVRRHMDVLTKEFERLGYSDIDFSCDGQSERQKSKSSPTNERENTDNTNPQQSKAQSGSIPAYGYSLSTAIDIRL